MARMQMNRGMRIKEAKKYVADKLCVSVKDLHDPLIMREVRDRYGIRGIKIWPFDGAARRSQNQDITTQEVDRALVPFKRLRDAFGDDIEIMLELHSNWSLPSALRIARAVEPYRPMWLEEPIPSDNPDAMAFIRRSTRVPIACGENVYTRIDASFTGEVELFLGS